MNTIIGRRWFTLTALVSIIGLGLGCGEKTPEETEPTEKLKVGILLQTSPGDVGWSYAHFQGVKAAEASLADVELIIKENVKDSMSDADQAGITAALEDLVAQGAKIIFGASSGYKTALAAMAQKYPDVKFEHCAGSAVTTNLGNYFGRVYQARYLTGIVAGMSVEQGAKLGYVAAFPIAQVVRGLNAFTLGVRSVNPTATVEVAWTKTWYDPAKEAEVTNALIDGGAKVIAQHQNSTSPVQTAGQRGVLAVGYHSDMSGYAPGACLTSAVFNFGPYYTRQIKAVQDGTWVAGSYWGPISDGVVDIGPYGSMVTQATKDKVAQVKSDLIAGTFDVFWGPIKKQDGTVLVDEGAKMSDAEMLSSTVLVEGVVGSLPAP